MWNPSLLNIIKLVQMIFNAGFGYFGYIGYLPHGLVLIVVSVSSGSLSTSTGLPDHGALSSEQLVLTLSCVQLFVTTWAVARQAPLSMDFSRQGYWSRLPFPILLASSLQHKISQTNFETFGQSLHKTFFAL